MDVFVGRQPIFNNKKETVAYELLYRSNYKSNTFNNSDGNNATLNVLINGFITMGINNVVENKPAFINFTEDLLKTDTIYMFSSKDIVVEILETVKPSNEIIDKCKKLKKLGYKLALDDFVFDKKYMDLIEFADIIKVDFLVVKGIERLEILKLLKKINNKLIFLAEKVETYKDFKEAQKYGYSMFQGYYFSKPVILSSKDIPIAKFDYLNLMNEINRENSSLEDLKKVIIRDVSLSYKFLKLTNSSYFSFKREIKSVNEAIAIIGEKNLRYWLNAIVMQDMGKGNSLELLKISLIRAKFAETLLLKTHLKNRSFDAYIMGILSMVDCLLNRPLHELLQDLFVSKDIKRALLEKEKNLFYHIYKLICSYENGNWDDVILLSTKLNIDRNDISIVYLESIKWATNIMSL
ncbi:EAL and HDOD domain-containing protein [Clostridium sp. ZS2-4]|uniref:EAL and HDOD domain-containing protein n=1 Tax=Clostridium sp. ZS2-4 TaxID=2987703 RepID=UPI00227ADEEA|nr:HDOD domain-containing protein [Clostridium sp. ZS2-4]MCY6354527.1 HDOD domain-containing protein [Clostridium sp. ZS2-4]